MPKIKMLQTTQGALDGIHIKLFSKGIPYNIPDQITQSLADLFLDMGVAKVARERKPIEPDNTSKDLNPTETKDDDLELEDQDDEIDDEIDDEPKKVVIMRVYQLADELDFSSKEIIELANDLGIHAPAAQSGLSEEEVTKIKDSLS